MPTLLEIGLSNAVMALVLAVLAALLCRLVRRPAFSHGLWLVVLLKLVTPPLLPVPLPWPEPRQSAEPRPDAGVALAFPVEDLANPGDGPAIDPIPFQDNEPAPVLLEPLPPQPVAGFLEHWGLPILLVWLTGSVCVLAWILRSVHRFQRLLRFAVPADAGFQEMVVELAGKLKLTRAPRAWLVPGIISPMLWALGRRPRLLFPAPLLDRLTPDQLRTIVLHELAHWRRNDHWVRFLELTVLVLYWWHPAVWWARAELREAEEQCCDAWVTATLDGAERAYATALLETVAFISKARLPLPVSASGIGHVTHLRRRLTMIMSGQKRRSLTWAGCMALAALGLMLLPLAPIRAQGAKKVQPQGRDNIQLNDFFVQGAGAANDKETIELLKRLLKLLEEKKAKAPGTGSAEQIAKAREEVAALTTQLTKKRREVQLAEARLREAQVRLAQLSGQPPLRDKVQGRPIKIWEFKSENIKPVAQGKIIWIEMNRDGKTIKIPLTLPKSDNKADPNAKPEQLRIHLERLLANPEGKIISVPIRIEKPAKKTPPGGSGLQIILPNPAKKTPSSVQPDDLKTRLDRLLREIEELRREIQRNQRDGIKK